MIRNVDLGKWMRRSEGWVNKWIKEGLIKASKKCLSNVKFLDIEEVVEEVGKEKE